MYQGAMSALKKVKYLKLITNCKNNYSIMLNQLHFCFDFGQDWYIN